MSETEFDFQKLKESIEANREKIKEGLTEKKDQFFEMIKGFISRMSPEKAVLYAGLAYLGYENLPLVKSDVAKMMWGIVGIELATSPAGEATIGIKIFGSGFDFPVNSQIAGLSMLAVLGFNCMPWDQIDRVLDEISTTYRSAYKAYHNALEKYESVMTLVEGAEIQSLYLALLAEFISPKINRTAAASLNGYVEGMISTWEERLGVSDK